MAIEIHGEKKNAKRRRGTALSLSLALIFSACGDDDNKKGDTIIINDDNHDDDNIPNLIALHLNVGDSTSAVVPIMTEGSDKIEMPATFTATVSGFRNESDAAQVSLKIGPVSGLSMNSQETIQGDTKTFVVTVQHNGQTTLSCRTETIHVELDTIPAGYKYEEGSQSTQISMRTGATKGCRIQVNQKNIEVFSRYANTTKGLNLHYELIENIVLPKSAAGQSNWTAVGIDRNHSPFGGSFDGQNHTITGLEINRPNNDFQGLFGSIGENGEVENIGLIDIRIVAQNYVGGVSGNVVWAISTGAVSGIVRNCYVKGNSTINGLNRVGGLVGELESEAFLENGYSEAQVRGNNNVGGVVGIGSGLIQNCYATGDVSGTGYSVGGVMGGASGASVSYCYATGNVSGNDYVGGVVGYPHSSTVRSCLALNPSVRSTIAHIGRISGLGMNVALTNNYAFEDITNSSGNTTWNNKGAGEMDGTDISAAALNDGSGIPDDFKSFPWTYEAGRLPGLFEQTIEMPEHLQ